MPAPALYLHPHAWTEGVCSLIGPEVQHARVLRLRKGDIAELFDGAGRRALCRVVTVDKRAVVLDILENTLYPQPVAKAVIALAFSKAARRGFFMEKAAELAAHEIWLWQGDHSQGIMPTNAKDSWQCQLIAGIKQCRNPWLPVLRLFDDARDMIAHAADAEYKILPWELPKGQNMLRPSQLACPGVTVYAIGPEGGFSERELILFTQGGFVPVSLGQRVLRCESAALLCLGLHYWAGHCGGVY